jgi:hypothetical protein
MEKLFQCPVSNKFWKNVFEIADTTYEDKRWAKSLQLYKPPDILELDFKIFHNVIFTYEKLYKIRKED